MNFKSIDELTFTDDYMFGAVMRNPEICKSILETLLNIQIEKLEYPELQKSISTYYESKGVRLDVYVKDSDKVFDIEVQNDSAISLPKRMRYYQSMVDMDSLLKGQDYSELKESFIIFICQYDPFTEGLPCYTFKNLCIQDKNLELNDETTKMIFNSTAYDKEKNVDIRKFLKYIRTKVPTSNLTDKINTLVEKQKENNKFRNDYLAMNLHDRDITKKAFAEGEILGIQKGISQGAEQKAIETAKNFLKLGLSIEKVAEGTGLTLEKVQELANKPQG
ncbi:MAG: Rpn family recombination-promoting nuclease/putative transposase [Treponema bryantii]|nr:Rpn family recombination-promoting nuclease/putative transposase [Treponema bryantii]